MGGYSHGSLASSLALDTISRTLFQNDKPPDPKNLRSGIELANLGIFKETQRLGAGRMGTTLTAAYVLGNRLHLAHVGDSRAYLIRNQRAICLTTDHTTVGDMVRARLISPEKVRTHAQRSVLTRALGVAMFVKPDISEHDLYPGDRLIICSDGLWSVIQDDDFARLGSEGQPETVSQNLIDLALSRETDDNASVVVFHVRQLATSHAEKHEKVGNFYKFLRNLAR
jgi:protein phosphatase